MRYMPRLKWLSRFCALESKQPIREGAEEKIWFYRCSYGEPDWFSFSQKKNRFHKITSNLYLGILVDFSGFGSQCEIVSPTAPSLFQSSHCVMLRAEVSAPIKRNTCCLTQIENTTRWKSDCSWSSHVTSFSNHCPLTDPLHWSLTGNLGLRFSSLWLLN